VSDGLIEAIVHILNQHGLDKFKSIELKKKEDRTPEE